MENASKALLIAGGVFLAMMILSLLLSVAVSIGDIADSQDKRLVAQQLEEFNKGYETYNKSRMYGTDVLTVFNKAKDENDYNIQISAIDKEDNNILIENDQTFKISVFKCEDVQYDSQTGRISKMIFRKIEI